MCPTKSLTLCFMILVSFLAVRSNPLDQIYKTHRKIRSESNQYLPADSSPEESEIIPRNVERSIKPNEQEQTNCENVENKDLTTSTEDALQPIEPSEGPLTISLSDIRNDDQEVINEKIDQQLVDNDDDELNDQKEVKDVTNFANAVSESPGVNINQDLISVKDATKRDEDLEMLTVECKKSRKEPSNKIEPFYFISRSLLPPLRKNVDSNNIQNNIKEDENSGEANENEENNKNIFAQEENKKADENTKNQEEALNQDYKESVIDAVEEQTEDNENGNEHSNMSEEVDNNEPQMDNSGNADKDNEKEDQNSENSDDENKDGSDDESNKSSNNENNYNDTGDDSKDDETKNSSEDEEEDDETFQIKVEQKTIDEDTDDSDDESEIHIIIKGIKRLINAA